MVEYPCKFDGCGRLFTRLISLNRHERTDGCIIKYGISKTCMVNWVQCDICAEWLHTFCIRTEGSLEE